MKKLLGMTALAGVFALGGAWVLPQGDAVILSGAAMAQEAAATDAATEAEAETPAEITIPDMILGDADAPVTIIEYGSYTCPHCASFHENQFQSLKADYIDTGKVKFIFREVDFDRFGLWASMIARCGGDMRYFGIHDILYSTQTDWIAGGQDPALIAANLRTIGLQAGLEGEQVDACMADEATAQALVSWFEANMTADEVTGTPTLFIDGTKYSNMSYADMKPLIDAALEG